MARQEETSRLHIKGSARMKDHIAGLVFDLEDLKMEEHRKLTVDAYKAVLMAAISWIEQNEESLKSSP